jgi:hypothetical protein
MVASLIKKEKRKNIYFTCENEKIRANGIYIVKCKALTKNKKNIYIFNPVPCNPVKTRYRNRGTRFLVFPNRNQNRDPDFPVFQFRFRFSGFFDTPNYNCAIYKLVSHIYFICALQHVGILYIYIIKLY